ncbi:hypothetical protein ACTFIU_011283 [Dictyostelium citrinum]
MIKLQEMLPNGNNNNSSSNSNNCRDNNSSSNTITTTDISTTEQHSKNNNSNINKSNNNSSNINNSNNIVKTTLPTHIALHKYNNELHRTLGMNPSQASSREPFFLSQPTVGSLYKVVSQITTNSDQTKPDVHSFLKKSSLHNDIKLCLKPVYLCEEGRKP